MTDERKLALDALAVGKKPVTIFRAETLEHILASSAYRDEIMNAL